MSDVERGGTILTVSLIVPWVVQFTPGDFGPLSLALPHLNTLSGIFIVGVVALVVNGPLVLLIAIIIYLIHLKIEFLQVLLFLIFS